MELAARMGQSVMRTMILGWIACLSLTLPGVSALADDPRLAETFGFLPLEIYKLDNRISNLTIGDVDGDKVDDVIVVNNARSRIDFLLSSKGPNEDSPRTEANQVRNDQRMRLKSLPVNDEVVTIQAGDFNGDGKVDLAYYGNPSKLVVLIGQGGAKFASPKRYTTGDAIESAYALAVGDIDRDGKDDLALLTASEVFDPPAERRQAGRPAEAPPHGGQPEDAQAGRPRRRRRRRPGDPGRRVGRPDPRPVLDRGRQARPRAALPGREPRAPSPTATSTARRARSC